MRELWRKTACIFWEKPTLWLPMICASVLAFAIRQSMTHINALLFLHRPPRYTSVLQTQPLHPWPMAAVSLIMLIVACFGWFANVFLYVWAFVHTSRLVEEQSHGSVQHAQPPWPVRRMVRFARKLIAWVLRIVIPIGLLTILIFRHHRLVWHSLWFVDIEAFVIAVLLAYLLAPDALRLLQLPDDPPLESYLQALAMYCTALALCARSAINIFCTYGMRGHTADGFTIFLRLGQSILAALPLIPLAIALALLAQHKLPHPEDGLTEATQPFVS